MDEIENNSGNLNNVERFKGLKWLSGWIFDWPTRPLD